MKEIEILIEVKSTKEQVLKALEQFESQGIKKVLDVYFADPLRKELQPDASGRLMNSYRFRLKDNKASVAYKVDHFDNEDQWIYSDEHETEIGNFETALEIQKQLGFAELVRIDNTKYTYTTSDYEIVFEEVKDLGLFLEVEKLAQVPDDQVLATKQEIREFLKALPIEFGEEQNAGKPELMIRKKSQ